MEEKSLGCIRKGGTRPIVEVLSETARPTKQGAIIMDTPGYDIASVTSMVAGVRFWKNICRTSRAV